MTREQIARIIFGKAVGHNAWENEFWREERDGCFDCADEILALQQREVAAPAVTADERQHEWFTYGRLNWECCRVCGILRRSDGKNSPCKGPVAVGPRVPPNRQQPKLDAETIQTLLDLLNPLHGSIDKQVMDQVTDERELDAPSDREYNVDVTARMERDLTQAVMILENRLRDEQLPDTALQREDHDGGIAMAAEQHGRKAELRRQEWQPIETAPKDGVTRVLASHWQGRKCEWITDAVFMNGRSWMHGMVGLIPTHWKPMPAPPQVADQRGGE